MGICPLCKVVSLSGMVLHLNIEIIFLTPNIRKFLTAVHHDCFLK
jgi:hypothetical protein